MVTVVTPLLKVEPLPLPLPVVVVAPENVKLSVGDGEPDAVTV